jgi:hypothetical protein
MREEFYVDELATRDVGRAGRCKQGSRQWQAYRSMSNADKFEYHVLFLDDPSASID